MNRVDLVKVDHNIKIGDVCNYIEPNIIEDTIFYVEGKPIGFYMKRMPDKMCQLADIANKEFRSDNVPKSIMNRTSGEMGHTEKVKQFSTILGSIAPRPHMRRPYKSASRIHSVKSAQTFVKAMLLLALESEKLIKDIIPEQYERQCELFKQVPTQWKFGNLFTSSISNYNISASYHRDTGNIVGAVNVIICKKHNSKGGDLSIPDYNATIGQQDNSIIVYPAWFSVHGVTPIIPTFENGYRNSLIFYPLKAFIG
jgi:hypothetical protein